MFNYKTQRSFYSIVRFISMDSKGPIQAIIEKKLQEHFNPSHLTVVNESYKHSVPKGSESHFKVVVISDLFEKQTHLQRHRSVNSVLKDELKIIHALAIQAKTPKQWKDSNQFIDSTPNCLGGSKHDRN